MRKIKFRVWDIQNKNFVKDSLLENINSYFTAEDGTISWFRNNNEYIIQQFTGLKDVDGVDIYEGDIVEWTEEQKLYREPVTFDRGVFWADLPLYEVNQVCKIIGNIFEG